MVQEGPLEVSIGKGLEIRKVMTESSVIVPTMKDLMTEMGAGSPEELSKMSAEMQKKMGNTATQLSRTLSRDSRHVLEGDESDSDDLSQDELDGI